MGVFRRRRHPPHPDLEAQADGALSGIYYSVDRLFEALLDITVDPWDLLLERAEREQVLEPILRAQHGQPMQFAQPTGPKRDLAIEALAQWIGDRRDPPPIAACLHHLVDALRADATLDVPVRWLEICAITNAEHRRSPDG